jgi:hypothetical protein
MRISHRLYCSLALIAVISLAPLGCEEAADSENAIQKSLDQAILKLDSALRGSNFAGLEKVISDTKKLRPTLQSQVQSKNTILATANEKLAKLSYQAISAEAKSLSIEFQRAATQSHDIATLRITAKSDTSGKADITIAQRIALADVKETFKAQLQNATSAIEDLRGRVVDHRDIATELERKAYALLTEAENAGLIDGHKTYKTGAKKLREAQKKELIAAGHALEHDERETPRQEDAQAELEAIATKLLGLEQTASLLRQLSDNAVETSANLRQIADELDNDTAALLSDTVASATELKKLWNETTARIQDAIKNAGQNRKASKETKAARGVWKLDMELVLGSIEEAKRQFLLTEAHALNTIIENGLVTSANKWRELSNTISAEVETATISAIAAYDNAKKLADHAGAKGATIKAMIDNRIAVLNGEQVVAIQTATTSPNTSTTGSIGSSFSTPQDLVKAFNAVPPIDRNDGTATAPNLSQYFVGEGANGQKMIDIMQKISSSSANLAIAIRAKMGEGAIQEMLASVPQSNGVGMMPKIDPSSVSMQGEDSATAVDVMGNSMQFKNTNQGWKVALGGNASGDSQGAEFAMLLLEGLGSIADVMATITDRVNSGELTTLDQIEEAMATAAGSINPF